MSVTFKVFCLASFNLSSFVIDATLQLYFLNALFDSVPGLVHIVWIAFFARTFF